MRKYTDANNKPHQYSELCLLFEKKKFLSILCKKHILAMKYFLLILLAALIIIQFFRIDKSVPEYDKSGDFIARETPPEPVKNMLVRTCYDSHSNETVYPWYSEVAPLSWWLADHIEEGREHLNYSTWGEQTKKRKKHKLEEMIEEIEEGEMPLNSYTLAHSEASLTVEEKKQLINWLKKVNSGL